MSSEAAKFLTPKLIQDALTKGDLMKMYAYESDIFKAICSKTKLIYCQTCDEMVEVDKAIASTPPWRTDVFRWK